MGTQVDRRDDGAPTTSGPAAAASSVARSPQQSAATAAGVDLKPISTRDGEKLAKMLKAVKYVECSATTRVGDLCRTGTTIYLYHKWFQTSNAPIAFAMDQYKKKDKL